VVDFAELAPVDGAVAVLVHLPQHVLDLPALGLVSQLQQRLPQLADLQHIVLVQVQEVEHALEVLSLIAARIALAGSHGRHFHSTRSLVTAASGGSCSRAVA
jgi:hypothetical protein